MASKWWVASAALLTLFAGCLEQAPGADPIDSAQDDHDHADGDHDHGSDATAPANAAPTANLTASATAGTAPLNVTFDLDGTDPDGHNLTWVLTVGNDTVEGDVLPARVNRTLQAGNYTVVLTVHDGNLTGNATLTILVEAVAAVVEDAGDGLCHAAAGDYTTLPPAGPAVLYLADGSWVYEESNGVPGLQWSGEASLIDEHHSKGEGCVGGDTLLL